MPAPRKSGWPRSDQWNPLTVSVPASSVVGWIIQISPADSVTASIMSSRTGARSSSGRLTNASS